MPKVGGGEGGEPKEGALEGAVCVAARRERMVPEGGGCAASRRDRRVSGGEGSSGSMICAFVPSGVMVASQVLLSSSERPRDVADFIRAMKVRGAECTAVLFSWGGGGRGTFYDIMPVAARGGNWLARSRRPVISWLGIAVMINKRDFLWLIFLRLR